MKILIKLFILLSFIPVITFAGKKEIVWLTADFSPHIILSGPYKNMGAIDYMHKKVRESLSDYRHVTAVANAKRALHEIKKKGKVVYVTALKNRKREQFAVFSLPYLLFRSNRILIRKKKMILFKEYVKGDYFDLKRSLKNDSLSLGTSLGRSYGEAIDRILLSNSSNTNLIKFKKNPSPTSVKNLLNDNIDYLIGYSSEAKYYIKINRIDESLLSFSVKGMPEYLLVHFIAPKTDWGRKIIIRINKTLLKYRNTEEFHRKHEYWMDKKEKNLYRQKIRDFYRIS